MTFRHAMAGAAAASALLGAGTGVAQAAPNASSQVPTGLEHSYLAHYAKVKKLGGQPGRNLVDDGIRRHGHEQAAKAGDLRRSLTVLVRMEGQLSAPRGSGASAPASASGSAPSGTLSSIAACESGGNPSAVGGGGTYRGKYQFDQQTWESVGGTGDPASAPVAEQDAMAAKLYAQRGASAWPVCGR